MAESLDTSKPLTSSSEEDIIELSKNKDKDKCQICGQVEDHDHNVYIQEEVNPEAWASFASGPSPITVSPADASFSSGSTSSTSSTDLSVNWTPYIPDPLSIQDTVPQAQAAEESTLRKFITHDVPTAVNYLMQTFTTVKNDNVPAEDVTGHTDSLIPAQRVKRDTEGDRSQIPNPAAITITEIPSDSMSLIQESSTGSSKDHVNDLTALTAPPKPKRTKLVMPPTGGAIETSQGKGASCLSVIQEESSTASSGDATPPFPSNSSAAQQVNISMDPNNSVSYQTPGESVTVPVEDVESAAGGTSCKPKTAWSKPVGFVSGMFSSAHSSGSLGKKMFEAAEIIFGGNPSGSGGPSETTPLLSPSTDVPVPQEATAFQAVMKTIFDLLPANSAVQTAAKVTTLVAGGTAGAVCTGIYISGQPVGPTLHKWWKTAIDWAFRSATGSDHTDDDYDDGNGTTTTTTVLPFSGGIENILLPNVTTDAIVHLVRDGRDYFYPY